jgi:hypothetical protein
MERKNIIIIISCIILCVSCFDPDKIPVAPFTHIPLSAIWTTYIERRISYETEQKIL